MKQLLLASVFFCSVTVLADFSGNWTMTGFANGGDKNVQCEPTTVQITHTASSLSVAPYTVKCEAMEVEYDGYELQIKNGEIWTGDTRLGTITDSSVAVHFCGTMEDGAEACMDMTVDKTTETAAKWHEVWTYNGALFLEMNMEVNR